MQCFADLLGPLFPQVLKNICSLLPWYDIYFLLFVQVLKQRKVCC